ncbi:hypothetical protein CC1_23690 [Coprococcus catus GD/7]|uniref:Uncharacterized protein n=1 Tax=Coprococcus catus GD/7 TaxID=717962 RepID=D4J9L6_9FIRM|nr:hypothetical protein CC1_23690 [Coprococcus catus GD/7]
MQAGSELYMHFCEESGRSGLVSDKKGLLIISSPKNHVMA